LAGRLIDRFMPDPDVRTVHAIRIRAEPERILAVAEAFDLESLGAIRGLFRLRGWMLGARPLPPRTRRGLLDQMSSIGWVTLSAEPGRQRVLGSVTRPWEADVRFVPVPPDRFEAFSEPGMVKIVWTLEAEPDPSLPGTSLFRTETRAQATDPAARRRFRWYWLLFNPGIRLLRRLLLPAVRRACEQRGRADPAPGVRKNQVP